MTLLERIIGLVAPHSCVLCGGEGSVLCPVCALELESDIPERCYRCHKASPDSTVCMSCRRSSGLNNVWVALEYRDVAKDLIHRLKFERTQAAAIPTAKILAARLPYLPPDTIVTYLPTATHRRRLRGYDQAQLLAAEIARQLNLPLVTLLSRLGQTRQVGAKRAVRIRQATSMFRPIRPHIIQGSRVLVVDDIMTTGASLEEAARILRKDGAKKVYGAVFAQKQ